MPTTDDLLSRVPDWLLRPLPANAAVDEKLIQSIDKLEGKITSSLFQAARLLENVRLYAESDTAANPATPHLWLAPTFGWRWISF